MNKPRILLVLTEFPPRIGGMQTHALYLSSHLHKRGYPVEVVTYQPTKEFEAEQMARVDNDLPFPVHRVMSRLGYHHNFELLRKIGERFQPDLVYCSTVFYGKLSKMLGVPVLARSVGNDVLRPWIAYPYKLFSRTVGINWLEDPLHRHFRKLDYPEAIEALYRAKRRKLMIDSAKHLTRILANSQYTSKLLADIGVEPHRIHVLVGGVEASRFSNPPKNPIDIREHWSIPPDRYVAMTACRLVKKKGVDFLLDSMEQITKEIPDFHLMIVGNGRHKKRFQRMALRSSASEHITFTGRVEHKNIHALYAQSNLFVLASRVQVDPVTGLKDAETMGRVLCEANAAGIPVVAARSGGIPSVIRHGHNGLLFQPDNVRSLIDTLQAVRATPKHRQRMVEQGRQMATEHFDWSVIVEAHERHFFEVLHPQGSTIYAPTSHAMPQARVP